MTENLIDLTKPDFWLIFLAAIILVSPIINSHNKSIAWAFINCAFIFTILNVYGIIFIASIVGVYLTLQIINGKYRKLATFVSSFILLLFFLIHKSTDLGINIEPLTPIKNTLFVLGFSYIALRMVEVIRAVFEKRHPPPSIVSLINYLAPFHMLAAGPIQSYDDYIAKPITVKSVDLPNTVKAIERIVFGLFKKFVLAYLIQDIFLTDFESKGLYFYIEVQFFFIWLYLDFSAYSDIAVGVGHLLGISTPENFNQPYLARNAIEFWERWHISLSQFIRRNIFIPIQLSLNRRDGGKKPLLSATIAFTIAFILCGLWHGLAINFLLWGGIHAFGLVIANSYKSFLKKRLGTQGLKQYQTNTAILYISRFITYEFVAFSLVVLFFP